MNVLLIGGGGREHSIAWKILGHPGVNLFCIPGNAGIEAIAASVPVNPNSYSEIIDFCKRQDIGLVVVGPEAPLVGGLSDGLRDGGIPVFGPSQAASQLEASKAFTKKLCRDQNIPTAAYGHFADAYSAMAFAHDMGAPLVVKADGLAAGKGVTICETLDEASEAIRACFAGAFGQAGSSVVIEEKLSGEEMSLFALCDGQNAVPFGTAQDYKRAYDGDLGPNTGGMGAVSPAPLETPALIAQVMAEIVQPTLNAMGRRGTPFQGVLFAGLMITPDGPKLIEYNVRFGDPECQTLMLRLESDLLPILLKIAHGEPVLEGELVWSEQTALAVVMAANGYPGNYATGSAIGGLAAAQDMENITVFHAGTAKGPGNAILSNGGRVLNVCAVGETAGQAQERAYHALEKIDWPGGFFRRDVGWRSIVRR